MLVAAALWLLGGLVGVSIIVATTSGAPAGAGDAAVQSVGGFYLTAVGRLRQFALSTIGVGVVALPFGYAFLRAWPIGAARRRSLSRPVARYGSVTRCDSASEAFLTEASE